MSNLIKSLISDKVAFGFGDLLFKAVVKLDSPSKSSTVNTSKISPASVILRALTCSLSNKEPDSIVNTWPIVKLLILSEMLSIVVGFSSSPNKAVMIALSVTSLKKPLSDKELILSESVKSSIVKSSPNISRIALEALGGKSDLIVIVLMVSYKSEVANSSMLRGPIFCKIALLSSSGGTSPAYLIGNNSSILIVLTMP